LALPAVTISTAANASTPSVLGYTMIILPAFVLISCLIAMHARLPCRSGYDAGRAKGTARR
jgi:hypothetical protein